MADIIVNSTFVGKAGNQQVEGPPLPNTMTIASATISKRRFLNVVQFATIKNFGPGVLRIGWASLPAADADGPAGVNGDDAADDNKAGFFELAVNDVFSQPVEFKEIFRKAVGGACRITQCYTLSNKPSGAFPDLLPENFFDGVLGADPALTETVTP